MQLYHLVDKESRKMATKPIVVLLSTLFYRYLLSKQVIFIKNVWDRKN